MKSLLNQLKTKSMYSASLIIASLVGGLTSAIVLAAIPDSNGQINTCYKNSTLVLRVTDPSGNCASNETALSWDKGLVGYGYIRSDGTFDFTRSKNVSSVVTLSSAQSNTYCFTTGFSPSIILATASGSASIAWAGVRGSDQAVDNSMSINCDPSASIIVQGPGSGTGGYFYFR